VTVSIRDKGDLAMPVILRIETTNGFTILNYPAEVWFSGSRSMMTKIPLKGTFKSITLDPENRFQDLDRSNNIWPRE
jgi:hypothetical protein